MSFLKIGDKCTTKEGYEIEIIEVDISRKYTIVFNDNNKNTFLKNISYDHIKK